MKKTLSILLAILLVTGMCVMPVLAATDDFVPSIEEKDGPEIDGDSSVSGDKVLVITPYSQKDSPAFGVEDITDALEWAYNSIKNAKSLKDLCPELGTKAEADGVDPDDLVVAELFDATVVDPNTKEAIDPISDPITFTVKDNLNKYDNWYVMFSPDGEKWEMIPEDDLQYDPATRRLTISVDRLCAFAVVVEDKEGPDSPQTSDSRAFYMMASVLLASLAVVTVKKAVKNN